MTPISLGIFVRKWQPKFGLAGYDILCIVEAKSKMLDFVGVKVGLSNNYPTSIYLGNVEYNLLNNSLCVGSKKPMDI